MAWFSRKDKKDKKENEAVREAVVGKENRGDKKENGKEKNGKPLFGRLRNGLSKTRDLLTTDIEDLFAGGRAFDDFAEEIEERLITADLGVATTMTIMENLSGRAGKIKDPHSLRSALQEEILALIEFPEDQEKRSLSKPHVIMVVGVNGVGKTTTIGKLAAHFQKEGKSVLIAAADTFRAAAVEQLEIWAERAGADFVRHRENADPAAVAFDGLEAAKARGKEIVLIDTAGRLHTKVNLMEELKKIRRALQKKMTDAPQEILLVLDATTGQNAVSQAKLFHEAIGVTGIAMTKLDGTAKGGIVISICNEMNIPVRYIGVGEDIEDLQPFDPGKYAEALL